MHDSDLFLPAEGIFTPDGYARLLTDIYRLKASGLLILTEGTMVKKLYLMNGSIAYGSSNQPQDRLGDILLIKGIITQEQFDESSRLIRETGKKQGTLLVQMGAIDPKELFRGLILQVNEIAESPFLWKSGSWIYARTFAKEEEMIILKIHPGAVIREGIWKMGTADDFLPLAGFTYQRMSAPPFEEDQIGLSPLDRKILSAVSEGKTPADVAAAAGIPAKVVTKSFAVLTMLGFIALKGAGRTQAEEGGAKPPSAPGGRREAAPIAPSADETVSRDDIISLSQRLPKLTHYDILGVKVDCGPEEIKEAYVRKVKECHPDRFARPALEDLAPLAGAVFTRVNEALNTLSDAGRRKEYDRSLKQLPTAPPTGDENDPALAAEQFNKGLRLLKCGEPWDAVEAFRWAVRLNPDQAQHHGFLARALLETGQRLKEAEGHAKQALSLDGGNADFYVTLGLVYRKGKRYDQAGMAFRRALKMDPKNQAAQRELQNLAGDQAPPPDRATSILGKLFGK